MGCASHTNMATPWPETAASGVDPSPSSADRSPEESPGESGVRDPLAEEAPGREPKVKQFNRRLPQRNGCKYKRQIATTGYKR